jgi:sporulation protein YlmC with PRC-barrel domain
MTKGVTTMRSAMTMDRIQDLHGAPVFSSDREKIGTVDHVYYNVETNEPQWLAIGTGVFSNKYGMVPLRGASFEQDGVIVPFTKDQVKGSPDVAPDAISRHLEKELWSYYGQHGTWGQEYGDDFSQPAQPVSGTEDSRIRRWQWEHSQR